MNGLMAIEQLILTEIIQRGNAELNAMKDRISNDDFKFKEHKILFEMLCALDECGEVITFDSVVPFCKSNLKLHLKQYCHTDEYSEFEKNALEILISLQEYPRLNELVQNVAMLRNSGTSAAQIDDGWNIEPMRRISAALDEAIDLLEQERRGEVVRFKTGFNQLDAVLRGLEGGRLYVLGAEPKIGKCQGPG